MAYEPARLIGRLPDAGRASTRQLEPADVVREERARLIASLVRILGDWDVAEELVQDALVAALEHWPRGRHPATTPARG